MEFVPFAGRPRNLRLVSGELELIATLDVGPRVLKFGRIEGRNHLNVYPHHEGLMGGDEYRSYGGHRLWIAPEEKPKTPTPDNNPVNLTQDGSWHTLTAAAEKWHIQKEIAIRAIPAGFELRHRVYNVGVYSVQLSPWAVTVMAVGGECLMPLPDRIPQADRVLPIAPIVLWGYTDLTDPRSSIGTGLLRLKQEVRDATKIGAFVAQGWAGYSNDGELFLKRFSGHDATYPDYGCNFEAFTRKDMLEMESLGAFQTVNPGKFAEHTECWSIISNWPAQVSDKEALSLVQAHLKLHPTSLD